MQTHLAETMAYKYNHKSKFSLHNWHHQRSLGMQSKSISDMSSYLNRNIKVRNMWNPSDTVDHTDHGGVFNFDFSPDGHLLVAACERRSILMFDPLSAQLVAHKLNAHNDCVNCVRFLDSRVFATCSDDTNIALWDARYLKRNICLLRGHSNWVKNIEYAQDTGQLVTSGFDGSIYSWDINSYHECDSKPERLFRSSGLIRTKLTPDCSKMIISTSAGYLIIIHDLDLSTLAHDLVGFKPDIFRLMQLTRESQRLGVNYRHLFTRDRNRVEFVSDFPPQDDAEVVSSLQVHPHGWCMLSRNASSDEQSEWSCVHDIQSRRPIINDDENGDSSSDPSSAQSEIQTYTHSINSVGAALMFSIMASPSSPGRDTSGTDPEGEITSAIRGIRTSLVDDLIDRNNSQPSTNQDNNTTQHINMNSLRNLTDDRRHDFNRSSRDDNVPVVSQASTSSNQDYSNVYNSSDTSNSPRPVSSNTRSQTRRTEPNGEEYPSHYSSYRSHHPATWTNSNSSNSQTSAASSTSTSSTSTSSDISRESQTSDSIATSARTRQYPPHRIVTFRLQLEAGNDTARTSRTLSRTIYLSGFGYGSPDKDTVVRIHDNVPRLIAYTEEANSGRGFIKEPCFSTDGRIICSPFGFGVRLLAFNPDCDELCDCIPDKPKKLYEIGSNMGHTKAVVTTKFSPVHNLLVTGCLDGKIAFHQPLF